jgi:peroxiredoxin
MRVIGVSPDSFDSHRAFAEKFELPFTLLIDEGAWLRERFGDPRGKKPLAARMTYVVDRTGIVRAVAGGEGVGVDEHLALAFEWAERLRAEAAGSRP